MTRGCGLWSLGSLYSPDLTVTADASPSLSPSVSPPSPWFHTLTLTAGVRIKKEGERTMWRQANLKAIIDHQPPWLVWLQCARCNWLGWAIRSFNRKYTLSLSISLKKWQHWEEPQLPEATATFKIWIHCRHHSNADFQFNKKIVRWVISSSGLQFTAVTICVYRALCCFLPMAWNQRRKELQVLLLIHSVTPPLHCVILCQIITYSHT